MVPVPLRQEPEDPHGGSQNSTAPLEIWESGLNETPSQGRSALLDCQAPPPPSRNLWGPKKAIRVPQGPKRQSSQPDRPHWGIRAPPLPVPGSQTSLRRPGHRTPRQSAQGPLSTGTYESLLPPPPGTPGTGSQHPRPPPSGSRCPPLLTPQPEASRLGGRARVAMATGVYFALGTHSSRRSAPPHPAPLT